DEVVKTRHGTAMLTPSLPLVWQVNAIRVEDPQADARELMVEADQVQAAFGHRKLVVHDEQVGARLSREFAAARWNIFRVLIMLRQRPPDRPEQPAAGAEVSRDVGAAALAAFRREQPFGWQSEAVRQLAEMDDRYTRVLTARDFVSPPGDPACACRLYTHDRLGQVDEVGTLEGRRRRGHARAAVAAAADTASREGCESVFMVTDAADWPQDLYRSLGFDEIGATYEFLKVRLTSRP
ncbi:MAG TPA: GNAT family N-acetyltransferase, partial [Thermoleophilaceae bacterium]|nr:GNAT family N-acetyltransferase [Thermoleophilaceae bacterium]